MASHLEDERKKLQKDQRFKSKTETQNTGIAFLSFFSFLNPHLRICLLIFLRERNINQLSPVHTQTQDWTRNLGMCPPTGNQTYNLLVYRTMLQQTEQPSQGQRHISKGKCGSIFYNPGVENVFLIN